MSTREQLASTVWPHQQLGYGASVTDAQALAREVVARLGADPSTWLDAAGFEVRDEPRVSGGLGALCLPMQDDRFRFVVFGDPTDDPERRDFLICHEAAHTFFYRRSAGDMPHRGMRGSDWEERFCDAFATEVTGRTPDSLSLGLSRSAS